MPLVTRSARLRAAHSQKFVTRMALSTSAQRPQKMHLPRSSVAVRSPFLSSYEMAPVGQIAADGRASFELFERLILRSVEFQLSRQFDDLPIALPEVPAIRHVMTHAVPYFPALVIFAVLLTDGTVETLDLDVDEDYWDLIGDDPDA